MRIGVTALLVLSMLLGMLFILYAWKRRSLPGAVCFILLSASIVFVNGTYIGELNSNSMSAALFWSYLDHLVLPLTPCLWLMMCLDYSRVQGHRRLVRLLLLVYLLFYYFVFYTDNFLHLYIVSYRFVSNGYFPVLISEKGWGFIAVLLMITGIGVACTVIYIRGFLKSSRLHRRGYLLMMTASAIPWLCTYFNVRQNTYLGVDYYSFAMIVTGAFYLFGLFHYHLFSTVPIATETVFRLSEDAIALTDIGGRITDANDSFLRFYPELKRLGKRDTLDGFLERHKEFAGLSFSGGPVNFHQCDSGTERYFSAGLTPIFSENGVQIGGIFLMKDITVYAEYENQLKILAENAAIKAETNELSFLQAQISPHFLNNTLSAIGSLIPRDQERAGELVVDLSEYLINCYRAGGSSPTAPLERELEAVDTYIKIVRARFGNRIRYRAEIDAPPEMELPRLVLQPLVENAVRHGVQPRKDGGTVCLSIRRTPSYVCFEIRDDGVGIEPERISTLLSGDDDRQGVGIINIHKRLLRYYGEGLSIQCEGGTSVSFRIPVKGERS
ncbi:histidine kinase N-terminal 7TM domain-containing protein [Caproicibacter sp. BJN0012]|uniref:histidine kinase N-terminal 7TM domain-containing protein n=1 Tax=Caproicibacter sp. BJN0012 TaxID=3110227 RepID=UPI002E11FB13